MLSEEQRVAMNEVFEALKQRYPERSVCLAVETWRHVARGADEVLFRVSVHERGFGLYDCVLVQAELHNLLDAVDAAVAEEERKLEERRQASHEAAP